MFVRLFLSYLVDSETIGYSTSVVIGDNKKIDAIMVVSVRPVWFLEESKVKVAGGHDEERVAKETSSCISRMFPE